MKIMRLGYTEGTILLQWYAIHKLKINKCFDSNLFNWLLSTSGYYDKEIKGSYFDFDDEQCTSTANSKTFNTFMECLFKGVKNSDMLLICLHKNSEHVCIDNCSIWHAKDNCHCNRICNIYHDCCPYSYDIITKPLTCEINARFNGCLEVKNLHELMENKIILIISCYANLIKQQVISGNCKNIYPDFFNNITIIPFQCEYTFFNKGAENNILDTFERYKKKINEVAFDLAIVSCGAYTHLLVPYIADELHKDAVTTFASIITDAFGIIIKRNKEKKHSLFWTHVPDEYKPENFEKIEGGCYW